MLGVALLLIHLPSTLSSCFVQSKWTTIRPILHMIDPISSIEDCDSACLGKPECSAYAFVNAKCALLGSDSGQPQICLSSSPICWVRTANCDASTTSTAPTTTTTVPTTTATTATTATCGTVQVQQPKCATCTDPVYTPSAITCPAGFYMDSNFYSLGSLKCDARGWIDDMNRVFPTSAIIYCNAN